MSDDLPAILNEIDTIEDTMRVSPRAYFSNEPMQARYRHLLSRSSGGASSILTDSDPQPMVPILSPRDFAAQTGTTAGYEAYLKVCRTAADWVFALPEGEQRKFVASLEALPVAIGVAAIQEIVERPPIVDPSSENALAAFSDMPEGKALMREWGHMSANNLALVRERLFRVIDRIEERSVPTFVNWLNGLSTDCAVALYRKLAA